MNTRTLTLMLAALAMLGPFATDAYLPSFHAIGEAFDVGQPLVQQTLSLYLLCFAVMSLFWGTLSDTFGRRPVILVALVMFGVGSVGAALAPSFGWLLFFRGVQGASAGAGRIVGQALVRDRFHGADAQRFIANISMVFSLAPAIAPIVGGYLNNHGGGWRSTFALLSVLSIALILFSLRHLPETLAPEARQPLKLGAILRNYLKAARNLQFMVAITGVGFAFAGFALYISSAASFIMGILDLPETAFAWLFVPFITGMFCGSMINSRFAGRFQLSAMIRTGHAIMALGAVFNVAYNTLFVAAVPWAVMPIFVYAFGMSLALPGMTIITLNSFPSMRGLASSLQSTMQMLIFAVVSGFVAPLLFESALWLALGMAGSAALCIGIWALSQHMNRGSHETSSGTS